MITFCENNLKEFRMLLNELSEEEYGRPLDFLFGASIGQHSRHILEFYQCIFSNKGVINYDERKRDINIETSTEIAIEKIEELLIQLKTIDADKEIILEGNYSVKEDNLTKLTTNLNRELVHCLEHGIHHQALIKVGLKELEKESIIPENFGVAPATIRYRNICVQ